MLEIKNITYDPEGGRKILDGISLTIPDGKLICLTGPNGGVVYVYKYVITNDNDETTSGEGQTATTTLTQFQILDYVQGSETNTIEVLQGLPRETTASLDFHAYLVQKYSDDRAANFNGVKDTYATPTPAPSDDSSGTTTSGN